MTAAVAPPARPRRPDPRTAVTPPMLRALRRALWAPNGSTTAAGARACRNTINAMVARGLAATWIANYGGATSDGAAPVNDVRYYVPTEAGARAVAAAARVTARHRRALAALAAAPDRTLALRAAAGLNPELGDCLREALVRRHYLPGTQRQEWQWILTAAGAVVVAQDAAAAAPAGAAS